MGRSKKKWHLKEDNEKYFLSHGDGLMKVPSSDNFLGYVVELIKPTKGKHSCDGVTVSIVRHMHCW